MHDEVKKFLKEIQSKGGKSTMSRHGSYLFNNMMMLSDEAKKAKRTVDKSVDSI